MKKIFLDKLSSCGHELDTFISRFMSIKENIGNGVGAGKLFERLFVDFINKKMTDVYALHLNLSNSSFIWDIIISDDSEIKSKKEIIISIVKNGVNIEENISKIIGSNWIGTSLKTYKEDACQITTDYTYREYLNKVVGDGSITGTQIDEFFSLLNKHDNEKYIILALNTYDRILSSNLELEKLETSLNKLMNTKNKTKKTYENIEKQNSMISDIKSKTILNEYSFRLLSFDRKFDKITFKANRTLTQYDISINEVIYFKVLYGMNQANAFQRGIWTHNDESINYFTQVKSGKYTESSYFEDSIISTMFI